ncbi:MAG: DJ-1/PfpI family protein [Solibacillus sp.]|uniref:DJ-1/PfpI family protein n=1 Tax=unclassified Solibacillus TaxID=2637870 RepID=UPI0030F90C65
MKKTAILLYPQFSEYELTTALSLLMQGGKPISVISLDRNPIIGEAGLSVIADQTIDEIHVEDFDSLLLTGCMDIFKVLENHTYIDFIKNIANQEHFIIASISSSPALLAKAGLLTNKNYTVGLFEEARVNSRLFDDANYVNELVVQDGNLITALGVSFITWGVMFAKALQLEFDEGWYREGIR